MTEQYLGKQASDDIFFSAMLTGLIPEGKVCELAEGIQKGAGVMDSVKGALGALGTIGSGAIETAKSVGPVIAGTAIGGAATGVLGATVYDILKERVSQEDPETKFNADLEKLYAHKKRELEDRMWMNRIRSMRDELKRGYKKMTTDEYATKYKALMAALDERSE